MTNLSSENAAVALLPETEIPTRFIPGHNISREYFEPALALASVDKWIGMVLENIDHYYTATGETSILIRTDYVIQKTYGEDNTEGEDIPQQGHRRATINTLIVNKTNGVAISIDAASTAHEVTVKFFITVVMDEDNVYKGDTQEFECSISIHAFANPLFSGQLFHCLQNGFLDAELLYSTPAYH